ncbi:MAG: Gfo/Idh/MocA family oxidoreductase [Planctomycetota bacterium]
MSSVTRRTFVKTAAAAAAVPLFATQVKLARGQAAGSDRLRVGLVGCGGRGTGAAAQALTADRGAVLVAMGDAFMDRLETSLSALKAEHGEQVQVDREHCFTGFDAYQKVIDSVDVVLLAAPPHFRPAHLKYAVEQGKHVFCEKPMAVDGPGVRSVIATAEAAKQKKLTLLSGFCWRYSDPERATFEQVLGGAIGDLTAIYTCYLTGTLGTHPRQPGWSDMEWQLRNWQHFTWLAGDHIVEQAVHSIDKMSWAMNGMLPVKCNALGGRQSRTGAESGNVWDHFSVEYEYENGARGFHMCRQNNNCANENTDYLMGTKGTCFINGFGNKHVIKGEKPWEYNGPHRDMYQNEHDVLFDSIRNGKAHNDGTWMTQSTLLAIMGRMAAYTGQVVTWEQALNSQEDLSPKTYAWGPVPMPAVAIPGQTKLT